MSEETKEFFKTDRGKAVIKLSLYIIFFIFIFTFIRPGTDKTYEEPIVNALDKYSEMTNYKYTYKYDDTLIEGQAYRDILLFSINDQSYYYDGSIYRVVDNKLIIDELNENYYINNHKVTEYIKKGTVIGKNEDYENNVIATTYSTSDMHITIYEHSNSISKVKIEIIGEESHLIEIEYMNINEVTNFTLDFVKE